MLPGWAALSLELLPRLLLTPPLPSLCPLPWRQGGGGASPDSSEEAELLEPAPRDLMPTIV